MAGPSVRVAEGLSRTVNGSGYFGNSPQGTLVYPGGAGSETRTLVWIDRKGVEEKIASLPKYLEQPRLSPDGSRLAVATRNDTLDIHVLDLRRGTLTRLSFTNGEDETPVWTPDGAHIVFKADPQTASVIAADGSGAAKPIPGAAELAKMNVHLVSISPDGKSLALNGTPGSTGEDILIASLEGAGAVRPFAQSKFNELAPAFSPDGKWIAYASDESGRFEIYVQPFPGPGGKWQVSTEGGTEPVWARNGKELFYRSERRMMAVPVPDDPNVRTGDGAAAVRRRLRIQPPQPPQLRRLARWPAVPDAQERKRRLHERAAGGDRSWGRVAAARTQEIGRLPRGLGSPDLHGTRPTNCSIVRRERSAWVRAVATIKPPTA